MDDLIDQSSHSKRMHGREAHISNMNHVPEFNIPLMNKVTGRINELVGTPGPTNVGSLIYMVSGGIDGLLEGLDMHMQHKLNLELSLAGSHINFRGWREIQSSSLKCLAQNSLV